MSSPAAQPAGQRTALWICLGLVVGLLIAVPVSWRWVNAGMGTKIAVLGAGKQLSVLVTHDQRRVLIAAGSDGSAFSNALNAALPPVGDSIDVVLIDSRASPDVGERARGLSAKRVLSLPDPDRAAEPTTVQQSFVLDLSDSVLVSFRLEPDGTWSARVETGAGVIAITPGSPSSRNSAVAISLDDSDPAGAEERTGVVIGPRSADLQSGPRIATVSAGSVLSIRVEGDQLRLSSDFFSSGTSGERPDHLARLDRELVFEL